MLFLHFWGHSLRVLLLSNHDDEQVIAPFLIIIRVADRRALTGDSTISGNTGSTQIGSQGKSSSGGRTVLDGYPMNSVDAYPGKIPDRLRVGVETTIDLHHDEV